MARAGLASPSTPSSPNQNLVGPRRTSYQHQRSQGRAPSARTVAYEIEDSSGDTIVTAVAESAGQALVDIARAIAAVQTQESEVEERSERSVDVSGRDRDALLVSFANDVIFAFDAEGFLTAGGDLTFEEGEEKPRIHGTLRGEAFDPDRHGRGVEVKAATYHKLRFEDSESGWSLRLLLDL